MTLSTGYSYRERTIFDVQSLIQALRFFVVNAILAFIFLFLALEEIDWYILAFGEKIKDRVIDNTSWNIKKIFEVY